MTFACPILSRGSPVKPGQKGADVRPNFNWEKEARQMAVSA
jgi:hypothetical protein